MDLISNFTNMNTSRFNKQQHRYLKKILIQKSKFQIFETSFKRIWIMNKNYLETLNICVTQSRIYKFSDS